MNLQAKREDFWGDIDRMFWNLQNEHQRAGWGNKRAANRAMQLCIDIKNFAHEFRKQIVREKRKNTTNKKEPGHWMIDFSRINMVFCLEQLCVAEAENPEQMIRINNVNWLQKPSYILDMKARDAVQFIKDNNIFLPFKREPYTRTRKKDGTLL